MKPGPRKGNRKENREKVLSQIHALLKQPMDVLDLAIDLDFDPRTIRYHLKPEIQAGRVKIELAESSQKGHFSKYLYKSTIWGES